MVYRQPTTTSDPSGVIGGARRVVTFHKESRLSKDHHICEDITAAVEVAAPWRRSHGPAPQKVADYVGTLSGDIETHRPS